MTRMTPAIGFPRCTILFLPLEHQNSRPWRIRSPLGFSLPFTDLVVTKILNYDSAGIVTTCEANWDTTLVVVANPEVVLDAAAGICQEDSTSVVCSISNALLDAMYTHTWYVNDAGVLSGVIPGEEGTVTEAYVASSMPETNEDPANIQVWCEVADSIGCSATDTLVIEAVATPNLEWITPLPDDVCSPSLACVDVGVTNDLNPLPQINVLWANPNGIATDPCFLFQNNTLCPNVEDISATVQLVHLLAAGGTQVCESSIGDSLVVNPTPSPAFLLGAPQACWDTANAVCIDIFHDVENYALCEDDAYTYTWFVTPSAGLSAADVTIDDANSPVPEVCITEPGTVDLILEIENAYGCSQTTPSQPFVVRDLPNPTLTFTQSDGICMPTTVEINATSIGASDFTMFIEDYGTFENFNSPLVLPVEFPGYRNVEFVVSKAHTSPSILGYDNDGNPISTDNVIVCEVETTYVAAFEGVIPPTAAFSVLPSNTVDLSNGLIEFINESEGQVENIWIFGDGDESGSSEVNRAPVYSHGRVRGGVGCGERSRLHGLCRRRDPSARRSVHVRAQRLHPCSRRRRRLADNLNDSWFPSIEGTNAIESYEVCVFNRTGHRVWCSQDPNHPAGEQWDGTGPEGTHLVQTGVYTWRISLKKKNGQGADVYTGQGQCDSMIGFKWATSKGFLLALAFGASLHVWGQGSDAPLDPKAEEGLRGSLVEDPDSIYRKSETSINVQFSQVQLNQWAAGGQSSASLIARLDQFWEYDGMALGWDTELHGAFGMLHRPDEGVLLKTDDRIELVTKVGSQIKGKGSLTALASFRTQLAPGFATVNGVPDRNNVTSAFMAPDTSSWPWVSTSSPPLLGPCSWRHSLPNPRSC